MTPTAKLLCAVAAIALAAAALSLLGRSHGEPRPARDGQPGDPPGGAAAGGRVELRVEDGTRELVENPAPPVVDVAHPFAYALRCRVIDRDGLPVQGAEIAFGPRDCAPNTWPVATSFAGTVDVEWRGRTGTMVMNVGLIFRGHAQSLRQLVVRAGAPRDVILLAELGGRGGACAVALAPEDHDCRMCHTAPVLPHVFDDELVVRDGLHPHSRLADLLAGATQKAEAAPPAGPAAEVEVEIETSVSESAGRGRIMGLVVDAAGEPVAETTVIWFLDPDRPAGRTRTGPDGAFVLVDVAPGRVGVRGGGGSPGIGHATVEVFAGQVTGCEVRLAPGDVLAGRVLLPGGSRPTGWRVEYRAAGESWVDGAPVEPDGSFTLANQPRGAGRLLLWAASAHRLPVAIDDAALVGSTDLVFDLRAAGLPAGRLRVNPTATAVGVWVWQVESGRGAGAIRRRDGSFALEGLAPGFYRVAIAGLGAGWHDLGEHWVDGRGEVDLGAVPLAEPGRLRIEGLARGDALELYLRRRELDLRCAPPPRPGRSLRLPTGSWLAVWGRPGDVRMREFALGPDRETLLDLAAAPR